MSLKGGESRGRRGTFFVESSSSPPLLPKEHAIATVEGTTTGLKTSQTKALEKLGQRRYTSPCGFSTEQGRELAALSRSLGKQIGLIVDRQGKVSTVILGEPGGILIPELPRGRSGPGRLRGVRLLHTHLTQDGLTQEDLMDLLFLRLDSVSVLTVNPWGEPVSFQSAHLLPGGSEPYRVHELAPWDRIDVNLTAEAEALESELDRITAESEKICGGPRAVLVSVDSVGRQEQELRLVELRELARTAGVTVSGTLVQRVASVHPRHILGKGKLAELEVLALQGQASMIIFDGELTPAQLTSLTNLTERKVLDRTQLILDIFAQRASTRAGKLQVELAQLSYTLPRLVGKNRAMDRLMGGIGGRGPGETKLETDRRRVRERMTRLKKELDGVRKQRSYTRSRRARQNLPVVALVGYTNAGKSTLLNRLTDSTVVAENKLFATLDPTTRRLRFPKEYEIVLADTVGFIRNLPKELAEAFRATLEELESADLLIHVADASHQELDRQIDSVEAILSEMELAETPRLLVLNKWDDVPEEEPDTAAEEEGKASRRTLQDRYPLALTLSARTAEGLTVLSGRLEDWAVEHGPVREQGLMGPWRPEEAEVVESEVLESEPDHEKNGE